MKPILFSTPMVQAILAGNKTQTRRVLKPQPPDLGDIALRPVIQGKEAQFWGIGTTPICDAYCRYQPGDILWVRETFFVEPCQDDCTGRIDDNECPFNRVGDKCYGYRQQFVNGGRGVYIAWRPSIHMPRAAARIFLRVTDVRVERVQDISEEDAIAEGCKGSPCDHFSTGAYGCTDCMNTGWLESPQVEFMALWEQINAKRGYGWDKNPWVWCYTFERITESKARKEA